MPMMQAIAPLMLRHFAQVGLLSGYVPPAPADLDIALDNTQLNWAVSGDVLFDTDILLMARRCSLVRLPTIKNQHFRQRYGSRNPYLPLQHPPRLTMTLSADGSEQVRKSGSWIGKRPFEIPSGAHIADGSTLKTKRS